MANDEYKVDTKDPRLSSIKSQQSKEVAASDNVYNSQIKEADTYFDNQVDAVKKWEETQTDLQNKQTDFAIEKIEQEKGQAHSDYIKEQSGAYVDWQTQSNQYGANAEAMAARGMGNTGYSESSQVSMYNAYQNRVTTAREAFSRAVLNYDNAITEARLANSSALAQIAYESLQKQLEISLTGFQYKNTLVQQKAEAARQISQDYWTRYNAMYGNILQENALNETARYHDAMIKQAQEELKLDQDKFNYQKAMDSLATVSKGGSGGSSGGSNKGGGTKIDKKKAPVKVGKKVGGGTQGVKKNNSPTVDTKSVLALGYGPINAKQLNKLIQQGVVAEYEQNGKLKYKKVFNYR